MKLIYQYTATNAILQRMDPRTKMVLVVACLVLIFSVGYPWILAVLGGLILIVIVLGNVGPKDLMPLLVFAGPMFVAITIIHVFSHGAPYWQIDFDVPVFNVISIQISKQGFLIGSLIAIRLITLGFNFIGFSLTTDPAHWAMSLYKAGLPYRIAFMVAFAPRFLPLLQEEWMVARNALTARGYDKVGSINPFNVIQYVTISMIPVAISSIRRSGEIALAMELRGFSLPETTGIKRQIYREVNIQRIDQIGFVVALLIVILSIIHLVF